MKIFIAYVIIWYFLNWCEAENNLTNSNISLIYVSNNRQDLVTGLISDKIFMVNESNAPNNKEKKRRRNGRSLCGKKKKKKRRKYLMPIIIGLLLLKSIVLKIALKALALLSSKAIVLSMMSLILAAIMGLRRLVQGGLTFSSLSSPTKYNRQDLHQNDHHSEINESYDYYNDIHQGR